MKKTAFILSYRPLGRMIRRLKSAADVSQVKLIYWDRMLESTISNTLDQRISIHKIEKKGNEGNPFKSIGAYIFVLAQSLKLLKVIKPDTLHAELLNMLVIAVLYKVLFNRRVKIVYEVSDLHSLIIDPAISIKRKLIKRLLISVEKILVKSTSIIIVTSEYFFDVYYSKFVDSSKILYIPNSPEKSVFESFTRKESGKFTIGFIGVIRYKKQLEMLFDASREMNINVLIAGAGPEEKELINMYGNQNNIQFIGAYDYEADIVKLYQKLDAVYSVYDADLKNVRIALPNKLYEAIACEIPIIVASNTMLSQLVEKWGVGISVKHDDVTELMSAIKLLMTEKVYSEITTKCQEIKDKIFSDDAITVYLNVIS